MKRLVISIIYEMPISRSRPFSILSILMQLKTIYAEINNLIASQAISQEFISTIVVSHT